MTFMAYTSSAIAPRELAYAAPQATSAKQPFFVIRALTRALFSALMTARTRQAEREIARYLNRNGGKFTDEAEREIERHFLSNQSHW
jgi:hypothetical protein